MSLRKMYGFTDGELDRLLEFVARMANPVWVVDLGVLQREFEWERARGKKALKALCERGGVFGRPIAHMATPKSKNPIETLELHVHNGNTRAFVKKVRESLKPAVDPDFWIPAGNWVWPEGVRATECPLCAVPYRDLVKSDDNGSNGSH